MKSFRIYVSGGREPSAAGLIVISVGILAMGACLYFMDEIATRLPQLKITQALGLMILCALSVIGIGWLVLKLLGIPFAKKEPIQQPQQQRP
jgi:hypothetical protein